MGDDCVLNIAGVLEICFEVNLYDTGQGYWCFTYILWQQSYPMMVFLSCKGNFEEQLALK